MQYQNFQGMTMEKDNRESSENLPQGRLQTKADILENNLFRSTTKLADQTQATLTIDRKTWPNAVILKALIQLLPRFDIIDKRVHYTVNTLFAKKLSNDKADSQDIILYDPERAGLQRKITISATSRVLELTITGTPPTPSMDARIEAYFFNHEDYPGKLLQNGKIDFREINRFPTVAVGDDLVRVLYESLGTPGLTFDGIEVPVEEPRPMPLKENEGVEKIEEFDDDGNPVGYLLRSRKTGVVVYNRRNDGLDIDVTDEIKIKSLDYSIGNIGTEFTCPISMEAELVCSGFKVRILGALKADTVDGGIIHTNASAEIGKCQSGGRVSAVEDITVQSVSNSSLASETGTIHVNNELIDSKLTAPNIVFDSGRGLLTNSEMDVESLTINNVVIGGSSAIHLGRSLFRERRDLLKEQDNLEKRKKELNTITTGMNTRLVEELKRLPARLGQDDVLAKRFKQLVQSLKTLSVDDFNKLVDSFQSRVDPRAIVRMKQLFDNRTRAETAIHAAEKREVEILTQLTKLENKLSRLRFSISGRLRPSATLSIFCSPADEDGAEVEPAMVLETDKNAEKTVSASGTYNLKQGFVALNP